MVSKVKSLLETIVAQMFLTFSFHYVSKLYKWFIAVYFFF